MKVKIKQKDKFYRLIIDVETLPEHEALKELFFDYEMNCLINSPGFRVSSIVNESIRGITETGYKP